MSQTPNQPVPPQPGPPPPGYYPPPPPKEKHTLRNFVIGAVLFIVLIAACSSMVSSSDDSTSGSDTSGDSGNTSSQGGEDGTTKEKNADNSSKGKGAITWGNWQVVGRIQTKADMVNAYDTRMRVKNTGDSPDEGVFTLTYLKGNKILGSSDCTTATIGPGEIGAARCFSTDDYVAGWSEIQVENAF